MFVCFVVLENVSCRGRFDGCLVILARTLFFLRGNASYCAAMVVGGGRVPGCETMAEGKGREVDD